MKSNPRVTEKDYILIRELLRLNISPKEVMHLTGRSIATVDRVTNADTFEQYVANVRAANPARYGKTPEQPNLQKVDMPGVERRLDAIIVLTEKIAALSEQLVALTTPKPVIEPRQTIKRDNDNGIALKHVSAPRGF